MLDHSSPTGTTDPQQSDRAEPTDLTPTAEPVRTAPSDGREPIEASDEEAVYAEAVDDAARTEVLEAGDEASEEADEPTVDPGAGRGRRIRRLVGPGLAIAAGVVVTVAILAAAGAVRLGSQQGFLASGASAGMANAPVTIEVWADFQCPYCGLFTHAIEPTLLREYAATGRAVLRFRDYAFLGQESIGAAVAARCADRQGRFWAYHDLLYATQNGENQGTFAPANLVRLASFAGLDTNAFNACLGDASVAQQVAAETQVGRSLGIESTPTVRITGPGETRVVKGLTPLSTIVADIEAVAAGKPAPTAAPATSGSSGDGAGATNGASPADGPESTGPAASPSAP